MRSRPRAPVPGSRQLRARLSSAEGRSSSIRPELFGIDTHAPGNLAFGIFYHSRRSGLGKRFLSVIYFAGIVTQVLSAKHIGTIATGRAGLCRDSPAGSN